MLKDLDKLISLIQTQSSSKDLLKSLIELDLINKKISSYSQLATKSKISKSLLSDYINDRKNLSESNFKSICQILKTGKPLKKYLIDLRKNEYQQDIHAKKIDLNQLKIEAIKQLKLQLGPVDKLTSVLYDKNNSKVFASLGKPNEGVSLVQLLSKSKLNESEVAQCLENLVNIKLAEFKDGKYYPIQSQVQLFKPSEQELIKLTADVCLDLKNKAKELVQDQNGFIEMTAFSMHSSQIEAFKNKLREAIFNTIDEFENDLGDTVYTLNVFGK